MTDCVIGMGANLGDRRAALEGAVGALESLGILEAVSALYETEPVGPPQARFLNAAVLLGTELEPRSLLRELQRIETRAGRVRAQRWGPRTLDLDILWMGRTRLTEPDLVIPHQRLRERSFALLPLLDVAPDAIDPGSGDRYCSLEPARRPDGVIQVPGSVAGAWLAGSVVAP